MKKLNNFYNLLINPTDKVCMVLLSVVIGMGAIGFISFIIFSFK